ncbi:MAG: TIGR04438 family Trp-rich protein [Comamonas sp.]|jgi:small Trp-rich protein|nr:TIGR04438 family Trp-rich protein [Comamonas sp.]
MWLLTAAALLALLKLLAQVGLVDVGGISALSWWWAVGAFALTAGWFAYADYSGLSSRKAMQEMERIKNQRLEKQRELLGTKRKR